MKSILSILITLLISAISFSQDGFKPVGSYEKGNAYYTDGEYEKAIAEYENIINQEKVSPELYYNLGCAWYKQGDLPKAILSFERAKKLSPTDKDINFNLDLAYTKTVDDINPLPEIFIVTWWRNLFNLLSVDSWAILSIILLISGLLLFIVYFVSDNLNFRKTGFSLGSILIVVCVLTFILTQAHYNFLNNQKSGIIIVPTLTVKGAPDESGTDLFVIHEGTKVLIKDMVGKWSEIKLQNGEKGWIRFSDIEII